jgi:hypothetical protein
MDTCGGDGVAADAFVSAATASARRGEMLCSLAQPVRGAAAQRVRAQARAMAASEGLFQPRSRFRIFPVLARRGETFEVGVGRLRIPRFAGSARAIEALAVGVCTIGAGGEQRASELFKARQPSLALALDRLGTEALYRLSDRTLVAIRAEARARAVRAGEQANPGDAGIDLDQQATVLDLANAVACGVSLTDTGMLAPRKSVSFVVALGREVEEQRSFGRCRYCPARDRCSVE